MPLNEDMLGSEMRDQVRQIRSAQRRGGRGAAMKAGAESAAKARQPQSKVTSTNNPATMSRSSRRMGSGLLENAPTKETPAPAPTKSSGIRTSRSGGGDYPFTKSEPLPAKAPPSMTTGSRGDLAAKGKSFAAKEGMLRPSAANAAKGASTIAALEAAGPIMGAASALAAADEATGYKRTQYSGNFGGPSFQTNPYASGKPAYAGQSVVSKLMGVGKKGK